MASTYTPLGIELQATGENAGTWGTKTNTNLEIFEQISGGFTQQSIAGSAQTTTLSVSDGATGAVMSHRMIEFTGTITGNQIVTIPLDTQTFYFLRNSTSGAYTVQFKYASGSGDTFTFSATDKGDKIVFAAGDDSTNPNIKTLAIGTGIASVAADTSPQLGGDLDTNSFNIAFDDAHGINDENGNEQIIFQTTSSAVNQFDVTNAATGNAPSISATGGDTNIDVAIIPKGSGETKVGTGAAAATITSSGAHDLTLDTNSGTNSGVITITDGANGNISITPNGSGNIVLDGLTFPNADGSADTFLKTDGSGALSFAAAGGGLQSIQVFTSSGTYTKPSGINTIKVMCTGGGGGGGNCPNSAINQQGSGGGGGGTAIEILDASSITSETVTIGSGGGAEIAGGTSSFGSLLSASGGGGGKAAGGITAPGSVGGGTGIGGTYNLRGGAGEGGNEFGPGEQRGGTGGDTFFGGGGAGVLGNSGQAGSNGGGGGGAVSNQPPTIRGGGSGGDGIVVVEEYA